MSGDMGLDGRVAIVTGAGSGLGRSHALGLAAHGARIVATDINDASCQETVSLIQSRGGEAAGYTADLSDREAALGVVDFARHNYGHTHVLVNNAGLLRDKSFLKQSLENFEQVIKVHLLGSMYVTHACWPDMKEQGHGRVVFTTSSSGLWGNFGQTNYAAAKLGLVGLMLALRLEGDPLGIRVNTIAPFAQTPMAEGVFPEPLQPRMKPEYVSALVTYLCSQHCAVSGEIFEVGLGRIARVQIQRATGENLWEPASPAAVANAMPRLMSETMDRHFENLFDDFENFARLD